MFLGLDLGTSSLKALLVDGGQRTVAMASAPLAVQRPAPGHSEQDPQAWWDALEAVIAQLGQAHPRALAAVQAVGLAGHMHGAVLLDGADRVLRPCILWDDTRATAECEELTAAFPALHATTGNVAMPGFTAPKLLWVRRHEADVFGQVARVLLPKAWLRLQLTGECIEDMSDASGTLWLDVGQRGWSDAALDATGLSLRQMPRLVEGTSPAGVMRPGLAARWGIAKPPVLAGGAGDNAAGAVGLGAIRPGSAFVSLGTSGVLWATTAGFLPAPHSGLHAFCHAVPGMWHQMGVTLSAAASLAWWASITGHTEAGLLAEVPPVRAPSPVCFLPYLSGERTPHNDGAVRGAFAGLSHGADRVAMTQAVLEGVAFSFRDCLDTLAAAGTAVGEAYLIGGGSRSALWAGILASVLGIPLHRIEEGAHGGAFGAARLARLAVTGEDVGAVCTPPGQRETVAPDIALAGAYAAALARYRALYPGVSAVGLA